MARNLANPINIISIILMVLGVGLAVWGYQLSGSIESQLTQTLTGSHTDRVMTYYIVGAISFAVGLYLFVRK